MGTHDTSWGEVSSWYDDLLEGGSDTYQEKVILPNLLRLLEPYRGKCVLDFACGQGYFSRALFKAGLRVIGVDVSEELIAIAKKHSGADIRYIVAPSDNVRVLAGGSVDAALIVLALQNIENTPGTLKECFRLVGSGGRLFIILNHPAFRIPKHSGWEFDEKEGRQYRRLDSYLSEDRQVIDMSPSGRKKVVTISFHRPLQYYAKHLYNAGFLVARLEEWVSHKKSGAGPRAESENRARKEFPLFLMIEAVRI